jgi:hypothetical protein
MVLVSEQGFINQSIVHDGGKQTGVALGATRVGTLARRMHVIAGAAIRRQGTVEVLRRGHDAPWLLDWKTTFPYQANRATVDSRVEEREASEE